MGPQAFVALMRSFGLALSLSLFGATLITIVKATDLYSSSVVGVGAIGPPFGFVFTFVGPIGALTLAPLGVTFLQILFISDPLALARKRVVGVVSSLFQNSVSLIAAA